VGMGAGAGAGGGGVVPEPLTPFQAAAAAGRRKRKAKGWFCPVCRQPYTTLLRISAQAPNSKPDDASSVEAAAVPPGDPNTAAGTEQAQAKGSLSGMVSIARDMLSRKPAAEASETPGAASGQPNAT